MTLVNHTAFNNIIIAIGDGADPEVFTAKCTMNSSRGLQISADMNGVNLPDCDDDTITAATLNYATAYTWELSGSGVLELADDKFFADWLTSGAAKNVKIDVGGTGGTRYTGAAKCSALNVTGERNGIVQAEITLVGHGAVTTAAIA